jgi:hypothetical protein
VGDTFVISGLESKRAELAGMVADMERLIGQHRADLRHIDAVLRLFGQSDPEAIADKRPTKRNTWFAQGECLRLIFDLLRKAPGPMTTRDITDQVMVAKGLDLEDERTRSLIHKTVLGALGRSKSTVRQHAQEGPSRTTIWQLAA